MFNQYGDVVYADVATENHNQGPDARSLGWGRVKYRTERECMAAIRALDGTSVLGRNVEVRMDRNPRNRRGGGRGGAAARSRSPPRSRSRSPGRAASGRGRRGRQSEAITERGRTGWGVYVGNLPWEVQWQELKDIFKSFGPVTFADIATSGGEAGGRSQGWGRVTFEHRQDRDRAIDQLNGTEWGGRIIEVRVDTKTITPGQARQPERRERKRSSRASGASQAAAAANRSFGVFVGNLPWETSWQELKDLFSSEFSDVAFAEIATKRGRPNGRSQGWGTVQFNSAASRDAAIRRFDGHDVGGRRIVVRIDREAD